MYAVITTGGKQYRLTEGDLVQIERVSGNVGDQVVFDQVLLLGKEEGPSVGKPAVDGARVLGTIVEQAKDDKVVVFKFKRRKMYRNKRGHRQLVTKVRIEAIEEAAAALKKKVKKEVVKETAKPVKKTVAATKAAEKPKKEKADKPVKKTAAKKSAASVKTAKTPAKKTPAKKTAARKSKPKAESEDKK